MNIIAVDLGTSRIKAACFDEAGNMTELHSRRISRADSPVTQDAEQWFLLSAELLREINLKLPVPPDAVVLTGNMHALLGVDLSGNPAAPALLWSDNSAQAESDMLNKVYGKALVNSFGNKSIPVFTLPKMLRMKNNFPQLYEKCQTFMQSKDFLAFRLTGKRVTDPTDASGVLGMELDTGAWNCDFLSDLGLDISKFPEIIPTASFCGSVTAQAAALTGLKQGTPVVIGSGDLASAAVGSKVNKDTVSLTLGTAGQLLASGSAEDGKKLAEKLFVFAHADPRENLFLGSVPAGGFSFEWFAKLHNISVDDFFELASQAPLSDTLPVFMPYILGRGAPYMEYIPQGAWFDLSAGNTLAELCRAAVAGALSSLRQSADMLEKLAGRRSNLVLQALACREDAVRQTACALFEQQKYTPINSEASLSGAAVIGFTALGVYPDIKSAAEVMIKQQKCVSEISPEAQKHYRKFLKYAGAIDGLYTGI